MALPAGNHPSAAPPSLAKEGILQEAALRETGGRFFCSDKGRQGDFLLQYARAYTFKVDSGGNRHGNNL
jgi:hypothetical protein